MRSVYGESHSRTSLVKERAPMYRSDGSGRDTYIYHDNGGFNSTGGFPTRTSFNCSPSKSSLPFLPRTTYGTRNSPPEAKNVNYRHDGTGRDSYIM